MESNKLEGLWPLLEDNKYKGVITGEQWRIIKLKDYGAKKKYVRGVNT
jgi:hypothetical protein